jgi:hypothetical protein
MKEQRVGTDNSRGINRAVNKETNRASSRDSKGKKDNKQGQASKVRDRKVSRGRTVSNRVVKKLVVHKTVKARRAKETVVV